VFRLVKYRYVFLIISLIIIIPGTISLIIRQLDVGIDFAGGSIIELQQQTKIASTTQVESWLKPLNLQALNISLGDSKQTQPGKLIYIRMNTWLDTNVESAVQTALQNKFSGVSVKFSDIPLNGKTITFVSVTGFTTTPQIGDIKNALSNLPKTSDPTKGAPAPVVATPTTQPTVAASSTAQPTVIATGTVQATATAKVTSTPVITTTPAASTNLANIAVNIVDIRQGTTTQTINIQTRSSIQTKDIPRLQGAILADGGPYLIVVEVPRDSEVSPWTFIHPAKP